MNSSQDILLILLLSIFAQSTGTELGTNSNYLLLLLLALSANNNNGCNNNCGCTNPCQTCGCGGRFF